jgi:acetoin utilization protein AcuB
MFRVQTIDGVIFNGPLESLILSEEVKRLEKNYAARKVIDMKASGGGKEDTDKHYSHALKAYRDAVKINQEIEPILHAYTIMKTPVLSIDPGMNIVDAWNLFQSKGISHMPVLSEDKRIIGIVSDMDFMKYMNVINAKKEDLSGITINTIMTRKVITADRMTDIRRIAKAMFEYHIGTIPIVDNAVQLIGIITRSDILFALIHYPPLSLWG